MNDRFQCRLCGSTLSAKLLTLPRMPLTDDFVKAEHPSYHEYLDDIEIFRCSKCGIVQNPKNFDHLRYYRDYGYTSGHSSFTKRFMQGYANAAIEAYRQLHQKNPSAVIEAGSGDGEQLRHFKAQGIKTTTGVEPSEPLAAIAQAHGIETMVCGFGPAILSKFPGQYDICISSYTFDHVPDPLGYLRTAHSLLSDGGIVALEIHDLDRIIERCEYCLFEHEHTVYLSADDLERILAASGFRLLHANPLPQNAVRANSLIVIASKQRGLPSMAALLYDRNSGTRNDLSISDSINNTIHRIDRWVSSIKSNERLVGFGAGGRGVMTLAAMATFNRFSALLDSNQISGKYLTPKTRLPVVGPDTWDQFNDAYCLVFSYGYFDEIRAQLTSSGYQPSRIKSLRELYPMGSI